MRIRFPRALRVRGSTVLRPADVAYEVAFFSLRWRPKHAVLPPWKLTVLKSPQPA